MSDVHDRLDRLESRLERQQETIQAQRDRIAELEADESDAGVPDGDGADGNGRKQSNSEATTGDFDDHGQNAETGSQPAGLNRRTALKAGGLLALLFGGVGTASADPQGQVGTSSDPLEVLHVEELNGGITGNTSLRSLTGSGVTVTGGALGLASTKTDVANTFTESGVSVEKQTNSTVFGGSIVPAESEETTFSSNSTVRSSVKRGIMITPSEYLHGITLEEFSGNSGASTVYLQNSEKDTLETKPAPGGGGTVTFEYGLSAESTYYIAIDSDGSDYHVGGEAVDGALPQSTSLFEVTESYNGADLPYAFRRVRAIAASESGSATVEFPDVTPVGQWGSIGFETDPNGETVEVYVQTSSDGGSNWDDWDPEGEGSPKPVTPGTDLGGIPSDNRVRFRVELATHDLSNQPRLMRLSRQWRSE